MQSKNFLIGVNGLRAIAILSVAILHFSSAFIEYNVMFDRSIVDSESILRQIHRAGMKGVYLFFGISGFLITNALYKSPVSYSSSLRFIKKRVSRIYPPLMGSIFLLFVVQIIFSKYSFQELFLSGIASSVFLHDIIFKQYSMINPVTWSLEVEIQFYIFSGIVLPFLLVKRKFISAVLFVLLSAFLLGELYIREKYDFRFFTDYIYFFLSGTLVSVIYHFHGKLFDKNSGMSYDFAFLSCLSLFFYLDSKLIQALLVFTMLLLSFRIKFLYLFFSTKLMQYVAKVSYTYYLFHYAMFHMFMKLFSNKITVLSSFELSVSLGMFIFIPLSFVFIYPLFFFFEGNHEKKQGYFDYLVTLWRTYFATFRRV